MQKPILVTLSAVALVVTLLLAAPAQERKGKANDKPAADLANIAYGPHQRNVMDVWTAKSDKPTPLLVFIHGGGFRGGSKEALRADFLRGCLDAGISVASINYRLSPEVAFPSHYKDSARAIQFARSKAKEWNIDPKRIAASGGSAGAGTSLWLGFHDDLADPKSDDPVLRESSRLSCMVVTGAQSTYDPRVIKQIIGGRAHEHPAIQGFYGLKDDELDSEKAHKLYEDAAPITHLNAGDSPVLAFYSEPRGPLPANARPGQGIHHVNFGTYLKERMDPLKIECVIRHSDEKPNVNRESVEFLKKHLGLSR